MTGNGPSKKRGRSSSSNESNRSAKKTRVMTSEEKRQQERKDETISNEAFEEALLDETRSRGAERRRLRKEAHEVLYKQGRLTWDEAQAICIASATSLEEQFLPIAGISDDFAGITAAVSFQLLKDENLTRAARLKDSESREEAYKSVDVDNMQLGLVKKSIVSTLRFLHYKPWARNGDHQDNLRSDLNFLKRFREFQNMAVKEGRLEQSPALQFATTTIREDDKGLSPSYSFWYAMPIIKGPTLDSLTMATEHPHEKEKDQPLPEWLVVLVWQQLIEAVHWLHLPTNDKPFIIAHGDLNDGNILVDLEARAVQTSLAHDFAEGRFAPCVTIIDFGNSEEEEIALSEIQPHMSAKDYHASVQNQVRYRIDHDIVALRQRLDLLLRSSDSTSVYSHYCLSPNNTPKDPPHWISVCQALTDNDISAALEASKLWFNDVETERISDAEIAKWQTICQGSMLPLPKPEVIQRAVKRYLDIPALSEGAEIEGEEKDDSENEDESESEEVVKRSDELETEEEDDDGKGKTRGAESMSSGSTMSGIEYP